MNKNHPALRAPLHGRGICDKNHPAWRIAETLRSAGFIAYAAGGCVRDFLLGRPCKDIDIATSATPDQIESLFPKTVAVGKQFGIIVVVEDGIPVEVATFRNDGAYLDGRHPESVAFSTPREDAQRRDFTINGLFLDPFTKEILDFVGGRDDLARKIIRAIGDPEKRFTEDHLRMLRAVRFAGTLGFALDPATAHAIRALAPRILTVSAERIGQETVRIFAESQRAGESLALLSSLGLLREILPEVEALQGVAQPPEFHPEGDVFTHTRLMLDSLPPPPRDPRLGLAVLLHDIGKPPTSAVHFHKGSGTRRITFRCHAAVGSKMAAGLLQRLKLPGDLCRDVSSMVARHMHFFEMPKMRRSTLRRFMAPPTFPLELELGRLDMLHSMDDPSVYELAKKTYDAYAREPILPERWIKGADLIALGMEPGPKLGALLAAAYNRQLDGLARNKPALLAWVKRRLKSL